MKKKNLLYVLTGWIVAILLIIGLALPLVYWAYKIIINPWIYFFEAL